MVKNKEDAQNLQHLLMWVFYSPAHMDYNTMCEGCLYSINGQKETKEDDLMESLSEYLNIHTHRDYARCVISLINLFADNPISENESVISLFEEQIKNGEECIMKIVIEIEYKPCDENETFERTKEIVTGNIENCLGKVVSVKEVKE